MELPSLECPSLMRNLAALSSTTRIINAMGMALYGIDAACMAVLAVSASKWEGKPKANRADKAVMIIQLVTLAGERRIENEVSTADAQNVNECFPCLQQGCLEVVHCQTKHFRRKCLLARSAIFDRRTDVA